jgi:hypothetical protein
MLDNLANPNHPLHNADTGNHPLPANPMKIEAALRCSRLILELCPYFMERYGRRGEAVTRSDSGYLVTLLDCGQRSVDQEVDWLARVLGDGQRFFSAWRQSVADTLKRTRLIAEQRKGYA